MCFGKGVMDFIKGAAGMKITPIGQILSKTGAMDKAAGGQIMSKVSGKAPSTDKAVGAGKRVMKRTLLGGFLNL
jgi:hypothetical protein